MNALNRFRPLALLVSLFAAPACTVMLPGHGGDDGAGAEDSDAAFDKDIAAQRLTVAKLEQSSALADSTDEDLKATAELEMAEVELSHVDESDAPRKRAEKAKDVKAEEDELFEAEEELKQLEMLYKDEDLADKTREIVIERSKRKIARAKEGLEIARSEMTSLEKHELVQERKKLALEVDEKKRALESLKKRHEISALEKSIAVREAEHAVEKGKSDAKSKEDDSAEKGGCCGDCGDDADDDDDDDADVDGEGSDAKP